MDADPRSKTRSGIFCVPRDEDFSKEKEKYLLTKAAGSVLQALPSLEASLIEPDLEFPDLTEIDKLYNQGIPSPKLRNQGFLQSSVVRLVKALADATDDVASFKTTPRMFHSKKIPSPPSLPPPSLFFISSLSPSKFNLQRASFHGFWMRNSHVKLLLV